jgi:hypothetical protein
LHAKAAVQACSHEDLKVLAPATVVAFHEHVGQVVAGEEVVGVRVSRFLVEALPGQDFELVLERFETSKLSDLQ